MIAHEIQLQYDITVAILPDTAIVLWVTIMSTQTVTIVNCLVQINGYHY